MGIKLVKKGPWAALSRAYAGVNFLECGSFLEAKAVLQEAVQLWPRLAAARTNLAIALFYLNEKQNAKKEALKSLELKAGQVEAHGLLAACWASEQVKKAALSEAMKAIHAAKPSHATPVYLLEVLLKYKWLNPSDLPHEVTFTFASLQQHLSERGRLPPPPSPFSPSPASSTNTHPSNNHHASTGPNNQGEGVKSPRTEPHSFDDHVASFQGDAPAATATRKRSPSPRRRRPASPLKEREKEQENAKARTPSRRSRPRSPVKTPPPPGDRPPLNSSETPRSRTPSPSPNSWPSSRSSLPDVPLCVDAMAQDQHSREENTNTSFTLSKDLLDDNAEVNWLVQQGFRLIHAKRIGAAHLHFARARSQNMADGPAFIGQFLSSLIQSPSEVSRLLHFLSDSSSMHDSHALSFGGRYLLSTGQLGSGYRLAVRARDFIAIGDALAFHGFVTQAANAFQEAYATAGRFTQQMPAEDCTYHRLLFAEGEEKATAAACMASHLVIQDYGKRRKALEMLQKYNPPYIDQHAGFQARQAALEIVNGYFAEGIQRLQRASTLAPKSPRIQRVVLCLQEMEMHAEGNVPVEALSQAFPATIDSPPLDPLDSSEPSSSSLPATSNLSIRELVYSTLLAPPALFARGEWHIHCRLDDGNGSSASNGSHPNPSSSP